MKVQNLVFHVFLFTFAFVFSSNAQDKTAYFMGIHPLSNDLNPAWSYNRDMVMFTPAGSVSAANSSLTFHAIFNKGWGVQDSVLLWDWDKIDKKLKTSNLIHGEGSLSFLFFGRMLPQNRYASLRISRNYSGSLSFPESVAAIRYGNIDLANNKPRTIDLSNYALNGTVYDEFSFGLSQKYSSQFSAGMHLKLLQGKMGVKTEKFQAVIETAGDFSRSTLKTDAEIMLSAPVMRSDSNKLKIETAKIQEQLSWNYFTLKNLGLALDLGFIYELNERTTISGSVRDLGFIHWGSDPQQLVSKDQYLFDGLYFSTGDMEDFNLKEYFNQKLDTLQMALTPQESDRSFSTWLPVKIYCSGSYNYNRWFRFTGLIKTIFFPQNTTCEVTLGSVYKPSKRWTFAGNWSYSSRSLYNFGLGAVYTWPKCQVYAVTDNINSITILDVKGVNLAFGVSWILFQRMSDQTKSGSSFIRE